MRESIGGTWIFSIVIFFIILFASFLAISINYTKAFQVKNKIISIIEENEGINSKTQEKIIEYLDNTGYNVYGKCQENLSESEISEKGFIPGLNNKYKYCIATRKLKDDSGVGIDEMNRSYYKVRVFFQIDLPILNNYFIFPVTGETKAIYFPNDD